MVHTPVLRKQEHDDSSSGGSSSNACSSIGRFMWTHITRSPEDDEGRDRQHPLRGFGWRSGGGGLSQPTMWAGSASPPCQPTMWSDAVLASRLGRFVFGPSASSGSGSGGLGSGSLDCATLSHEAAAASTQPITIVVPDEAPPAYAAAVTVGPNHAVLLQDPRPMLGPTAARRVPRPPAVCCHSMVATRDGNRFISFGGAVIGYEFGDVYSYHLAENRWDHERPWHSHLAPARMSHSAVMIGDDMIVYGGLQTIHNEYRILEDTIALHVPTMTWRKFPRSPLGAYHPGPRRSHSAVAYKGKMYVYMGYPHSSPKELAEFDPATGAWRLIVDESNFHKPVFPLHGHSAVCDATHMYIFGGQANANSMMFSNKLYRFAFASGLWEEVAIESGSRIPSPRYAQVMTMYDGVITVHGGDSHQCTVYYDDTWCIAVRQAGPAAIAPAAAAAAASGAATALPPPPPPPTEAEGSSVPPAAAPLLCRWEELTERTGPMRPTKRSGHCSVAANGAMYVFGGECPSGDPQYVLYSAEVYRMPLALPLRASLADLAARWLSLALAPESDCQQLQMLLDHDNGLLCDLSAALRQKLRRHLARGTPERPSQRHRLPGF